MVNAQEYLDKNYPKDQRNNITQLNISKKELQGSLVIEGFDDLKELNCSFNGWKGNGITSLEIRNCPYLEVIRCQYNEISELNLQKFPNLKTLICNDNDLSSLDLSQNKDLEKLNLMNNNFPGTIDLFFLSHLVRLKELELGNGNKEKVEKGKYNRFGGSLENLASMNELVLLDIRNTDINTGLEKLPNGIELFSCRFNIREKARVGEIFSDLVSALKDSQQEIELNDKGWIKNFREKVLPIYKEKKARDEKSTVNNDEQIKQLKDQVEKLEKEKQEQEKEIKKLKKDSNSDNNKQTELEKKLNEAQRQVGDLTKKLDEIKQQLTETENQVDDLNKSQNEVTQNSLKLFDENQQLKQRIEELNSDSNIANSQDRTKRIQELEEDIRRKDEAVMALQKNKEVTINQLKAEIAALKAGRPSQQSDNLDEIITQANQAKSMVELETSISSLESYCDSQPKNYEKRKEEIDKLQSLLAAKLQLARCLQEAIEVADNSKDQEEGIFEQRRQTRQKLDNLVESTSPQAQPAYQEMNKGSEIDRCIEELAGKIWNHLNESAKKIEKDPANQELIAELEKGGHNKGTEIYETFWILRAIIKEFVEGRLNWKKEFNVYPYMPRLNSAFAVVDWRDGDFKTEIIDMSFDFKKDPSGEFDNEEWQQIHYTLAHELFHAELLMEEWKDNSFPRYKNDHTWIFWNGFLIRVDSSFAYVISCLPLDKQRKLKDFANPLIPKKSINPTLNFFSAADWFSSPETKKVFEKEIKEQDALEEWKNTWQTLHKIIEDSMNEDPANWKDRSELRKRCFSTRFGLKNGQIKIHIYFDKATMPSAAQESINSAFREEDGWKRGGWTTTISGRRSFIENRCGCGFGFKEEELQIIQEQNQELQAQVETPPKKNN